MEATNYQAQRKRIPNKIQGLRAPLIHILGNASLCDYFKRRFSPTPLVVDLTSKTDRICLANSPTRLCRKICIFHKSCGNPCWMFVFCVVFLWDFLWELLLKSPSQTHVKNSRTMPRPSLVRQILCARLFSFFADFANIPSTTTLHIVYAAALCFVNYVLLPFSLLC